MFIVAVMVYIRRYKQRKLEYLSEIEINNQIHQKEILATQLEIQQATMQHIGRELHDNIGQKLTLVSLYTQQLIYENKVPKEAERIEQISEIINQSLQDLRSLSKTLTDDKINQKEIVTLIQEEVDNANAIKKCKITFNHNFEHIDLNFAHKNVLLRITQEFIQNSIKHAQCKSIFINLLTSDENLWKHNIKDDGIGFDSSQKLSNGIGLTNMKNRAEIIGANFSLKSKKGIGTEISLILKKAAMKSP